MRFLRNLFIIAGLIAGYLLFQGKRKEREEQYWADEVKSHVSRFTGSRASGPGVPLLPDETAFYKLIYQLHKLESSGHDVEKSVMSACEELKIQGESATLIKDSLLTNLEVAEKMKLFDDVGNAINLERGEAAVIRAAGWPEEKTGVGQIFSSLLAPEAAQSLPNMQLMPSSVRDLQGELLPKAALERARAFERCGIITHDSFERIQAALRADAAP